MTFFFDFYMWQEIDQYQSCLISVVYSCVYTLLFVVSCAVGNLDFVFFYLYVEFFFEDLCSNIARFYAEFS